MNTPNTTELTPQEINLGIAKLLFPDAISFELYDESLNSVWVTYNKDVKFLRDYVLDWSQLMPLVVEYLLNDCKGLAITDCAVMTTNQGSKLNGLTLDIESETLQLALAQCLYKLLLAKKENEDV